MTRTRFFFACLLAACLGIAACSKQDSSSAASGPKRSPSMEIVAAEARGFTVGAMMSANAVYVFFDPQCSHCARLWEASIPLQNKLRFVWIPVSLLNASSASQGAALLSASEMIPSGTRAKKITIAFTAA